MAHPALRKIARALVRRLPAEWRVRLRRWREYGFGALDSGVREAQETTRFATEDVVHDLPAIYHYWSNTYLRPLLEQFGFSNPDQFFLQQLVQAHRDAAERPARFISLGSGNCDLEVQLAVRLVDAGVADFTLECLDLNPDMLARGRALAAARGVGDRIVALQGDFNLWQPQGTYHAVLANQSLHHVSNLEALFDAVLRALAPEGRFVTSDIIGRNGHQRWPEALEIVQEFWRELPERYRYNVQLHRQERKFRNWDCSVEGFEGIRAQDILRLLIERFGFELFIGYANVIDPFIDRSFGGHFDAESPTDRGFIDRVHARDQAEIISGRIKPTHMMAVLRADRAVPTRCWQHLTPQFCLHR